MSRITAILVSIESNPYVGIGKPEALKYDLAGCWSRRITKEHRMVYRVTSKSKIEIISLRFHY
jgi:toxin YoeB